MNLDKFTSELSRYALTDYRDNEFATLRFHFRGQSGIRTAKILNLATICLEGSEFYMEIGTYFGYTLASAGYENRKPVVGIDKDRHEAGTEGFLRHAKTLLDCVEGLNFMLLSGDFRDAKLEPNGRIGVFFVDGDHTYKEVMDALEWAKPHLAEKHLIVLDDLGTEGVRKAVNELQLKCLFRIETEPSQIEGCVMNPYFANGIAIYACGA